MHQESGFRFDNYSGTIMKSVKSCYSHVVLFFDFVVVVFRSHITNLPYFLDNLFMIYNINLLSSN